MGHARPIVEQFDLKRLPHRVSWSRLMNAPVVSVLNMKGGVGKTTISAHVMRVMYHRHRLKTLLVDLDPQFNLTQALVPRSKYDSLRDDNKTVLVAFEPPSKVGLFDVATSSTGPPRAKNVVSCLRYMGKTNVTLDLLPGDFKLVKYSLISSFAKLKLAKARFERFIGVARSDYDLIVIDCNPSSSFITTSALTVCTNLLIPVRPDRYSMLGVELLHELLDGMPAINPKPEVHILLNCIPNTNYDRRVEDELRGHSVFGERVLANRLPKSGLLEARSNYTGFATDKPVPYRNLLKDNITLVVDELAEALGVMKP